MWLMPQKHVFWDSVCVCVCVCVCVRELDSEVLLFVKSTLKNQPAQNMFRPPDWDQDKDLKRRIPF